MRFPPELLDDIRARLPVSQVVARKVALKRAGREMKGLSPFKVERTPSFYVNDHKGFYHCFASGEHGDIFTFLMKTEGVSFPEAVERLAQEAGVAMPKAAPQDHERESERSRQLALLEASAHYFQAQLRASAGSEARRYLDKRGLRPETVASFGIGYAPAGRAALKEHLAAKGFTLSEMIATGMLIGGDDIPVAYDRFRDRVMLPIADLKGRIIAFGGRALSKDVPAKYLNSPETPLFHKGHNLYNAHRARPLAFERRRLVVVEGYMDVVALTEAGFGEAVAPLGTALTEEQVQLLWRMTPEPVLCFDGDAAGRKAAFRAIDTVLPHLRPGYSVRFAFLPDGLDPDDLVRQRGAAAMAAEIDRARPLFDVMIDKEEQVGEGRTTPDARAAIDARLKALVGRIADTDVRRQYETELRQELWERNRRAAAANVSRTQGGAGYHRNTAQPDWRARERHKQARAAGKVFRPLERPLASNELVRSLEASSAASSQREVLMLRTLFNHPWLIDEHAEAIAEIAFESPALARLRDAIVSLHVSENSLDSSGLRSQLTALGLDKVVDFVERAITHKSDRFSEPSADTHEVEAGWRHTLAMHERQALRRALPEAERAFRADGSEDAQARIFEIQHRLAQLSDAEARDDSRG